MMSRLKLTVQIVSIVEDGQEACTFPAIRASSLSASEESDEWFRYSAHVIAPTEQAKVEGPRPKEFTVKGIDGDDMTRTWCDGCGRCVVKPWAMIWTLQRWKTRDRAKNTDHLYISGLWIQPGGMRAKGMAGYKAGRLVIIPYDNGASDETNRSIQPRRSASPFLRDIHKGYGVVGAGSQGSEVFREESEDVKLGDLER